MVVEAILVSVELLRGEFCDGHVGGFFAFKTYLQFVKRCKAKLFGINQFDSPME